MNEGRKLEKEGRRERGVPPFVGRGNENGGPLHHPPLNVALLLFVDHQEVVGVQLDGVPHPDGLYLQSVVEQFLRSGPERKRIITTTHYCTFLGPVYIQTNLQALHLLSTIRHTFSMRAWHNVRGSKQLLMLRCI